MFAATPQLRPPGRARSGPWSSRLYFPELLRYPGTENLFLALKLQELAESSRGESGGSHPRSNAAGSASHPPGTHL